METFAFKGATANVAYLHWLGPVIRFDSAEHAGCDATSSLPSTSRLVNMHAKCILPNFSLQVCIVTSFSRPERRLSGYPDVVDAGRNAGLSERATRSTNNTAETHQAQPTSSAELMDFYMVRTRQPCSLSFCDGSWVDRVIRPILMLG